MFEEAEHPPRPRAIRRHLREIIGIEIEFVCGHVSPSRRFYGIEVALGLIDGDDATARPNDVRQIKRRIPGAASDVEKRLTDGKTAASPGIESARSPHAMLKSETSELLIVRTEDVRALVSGHSE